MGSGDTPRLVATALLAGVAGLLVGSFLNVVVYRAPLGLSVSSPRSFCPNCRHQLSWWENIPIASWIFLRARCRACHQPISARYPLVELTTGVSFGLITWAWHASLVSAGYCSLAAGALTVALIEMDGNRAPLSVAAIAVTVGQAIIAVGAAWDRNWQVLVGSLVGLVAGVVLFALLRSLDPECVDPRGHGRSMLLLVGCWTGGLGLEASIVGASFWVFTYLVCMVGVWTLGRPAARVGDQHATSPNIPPVFGTPLVSALAITMVASLLWGG
jgi:leader peptidase (prepilin peptidase) / N-methyltransferase